MAQWAFVLAKCASALALALAGLCVCGCSSSCGFQGGEAGKQLHACQARQQIQANRTREQLETNQTRFLITGVAGPLGPKMISDAGAVVVLSNLIQLAHDLDGDVFIVGATDQYSKAMEKLSCSICTFEKDVGHRAGARRTENIAAARSQVLRYARNHTRYGFLVSTDLDRRISMNASVVHRIVTEPKWDVLSYVPDPDDYWDVWALRAPWYPENLWGKRGCQNPPKARVNAILAEYRHNGAVAPVWSAFMMLAVYRLSTLRSAEHCDYSDVNMNCEVDCEHVIFHDCLRSAAAAHIGIVPTEFQNCRGTAHRYCPPIRDSTGVPPLLE